MEDCPEWKDGTRKAKEFLTSNRAILVLRHKNKKDNLPIGHSSWQKEILYEVDDDRNLMSDQNGKKRKRALSPSNEAFFQPSFTNPPDTWQEHAHQNRASTFEDITDPPQRYIEVPGARYARFLKEDEVAARNMSLSEPGPRKPTHHSKDSNAYQDAAGDVSISSVSEDASVDLYEKEGKVESARRIKPNARVLIKQHSSASEALNSELEEITVHTTGSASAHGRSKHPNICENASENAEPRWGAKWRRPNTSISSHDTRPPPNTTPVQAPRPHISTPESHSAMVKPLAGFKPTNRLSGPSHNPQPSSQRNHTTKTFNFGSNGGTYNPPSSPPPKRRKMDGNSQISSMSNRSVIDVDSETQDSQFRAKSSAARSEGSHTQNGIRHRNSSRPVPEFSGIELITKPPRPANRPSKDKRTFLANGSLQARSKPMFTKATVVRLGNEDPDDRIHDDVEGFEVSPQKRRVETSSSDIIIPPTPKGSYKGTANLNAARLKVNGTLSRQNGGNRSAYFFPADVERTSNGSSSTHIPARPVGRPSLQRQQDIARHDNGRGRNASSRIEAEDSEDHLSHEDPREVADSLLRQHRTNQTLAERTGSIISPTSDDDSEDPLQNPSNTRDIKPSKVTPPTQKRTANQSAPNRKTGGLICDVKQAFSLTHNLLPDGQSDFPGKLHATAEGSLILSNGDHDVNLRAESIDKIEHDGTTAKIVIHKSRNLSSGGDHQIFLELESCDYRTALINNLKRNHHTINSLPKTGIDHLDKVFVHTQNKMLAATQKSTIPKRKRCSDEEEAEDIKLLKEKEAVKAQLKFDRAQAGKPQARVVDRLLVGEPSETRASTRSKITRSSYGSLRTVDVDHGHPTITPNKFYGMIDEPQYTEHQTRSSARTANRSRPLTSNLVERGSSPAEPPRWTELNPDWSESWHHSIVYPPTGKNRATVDMQDIERLDEGEFLNDSLINFYLRWLEDHLESELKSRVYFHNTYFYKILTTASNPKQKGINYEAVGRWTAKVDLLSYDYIIVPVNEFSHWYLAIICNAPKLLSSSAQPPEASQTAESDIGPEAGNSVIKPPDLSRSNSQQSPTSAVGSDQPIESMKGLSLQDVGLEKRTTRSSVEGEPGSLPDDVVAMNGKLDRGSNQQSPIPISDSFDRGPDFEEIIPELETIALDNAQAPAKKTTPSKKGKRKSIGPGPRRYDPKEPRIITLDSLGVKHSPTCTNLKNYLVAECKSKKSIDIPIPGALGTTAMNIPQQNNHCDCGLYLLNYVEKFVGNPDKFIETILNNTEHDTPWQDASVMRNRIRELLFDLQDQQTAVAKEIRQKKVKSKNDALESKTPKMLRSGGSSPSSIAHDVPMSMVAGRDAPSETRPHDHQHESLVQTETDRHKRIALLNPAEPLRHTKKQRLRDKGQELLQNTLLHFARFDSEARHPGSEKYLSSPLHAPQNSEQPKGRSSADIETIDLDSSDLTEEVSGSQHSVKKNNSSPVIDHTISNQKSSMQTPSRRSTREKFNAIEIDPSPEKSSGEIIPNDALEASAQPSALKGSDLAVSDGKYDRLRSQQPTPFHSSPGEKQQTPINSRPSSSSFNSSTNDNRCMPDDALATAQRADDGEMLLINADRLNKTIGADRLSSPDIDSDNAHSLSVTTHSHPSPKVHHGLRSETFSPNKQKNSNNAQNGERPRRIFPRTDARPAPNTVISLID